MTIESWQEFALGDIQYFDTGSAKLDGLWKAYVDALFNDMSDLKYLKRSLLQRIQTFDRMKDGVCFTKFVALSLGVLTDCMSACQRLGAPRKSTLD